MAEQNTGLHVDAEYIQRMEISSEFRAWTERRTYAFLHEDAVHSFDTRDSIAKRAFGLRWHKFLTKVYQPFLPRIILLLCGAGCFMWVASLAFQLGDYILCLKVICWLGLLHYFAFIQLLQPDIIFLTASCFENNFLVFNLMFQLLSIGNMVDWDDRAGVCLVFILCSHMNLTFMDAFPFSFKKFDDGFLSHLIYKSQESVCKHTASTSSSFNRINQNGSISENLSASISSEPRIGWVNCHVPLEGDRQERSYFIDVEHIRMEVNNMFPNFGLSKHIFKRLWLNIRTIKFHSHTTLCCIIICQIIIYFLVQRKMIHRMSVSTLHAGIFSWTDEELCRISTINILFFSSKRLYRSIFKPMSMSATTQRCIRVPLIKQCIDILEHIRIRMIDNYPQQSDPILPVMEETPVSICIKKSNKELENRQDNDIELDILNIEELIKAPSQLAHEPPLTEEIVICAPSAPQNIEIHPHRQQMIHKNDKFSLQELSKEKRILVCVSRDPSGLYLDSNKTFGEALFGSFLWKSMYKYILKLGFYTTPGWFIGMVLFYYAIASPENTTEVYHLIFGSAAIVRVSCAIMLFPVQCMSHCMYTLESSFLFFNSIVLLVLGISIYGWMSSISYIGLVNFLLSCNAGVFIDSYPISFKPASNLLDKILEKWNRVGIKPDLEDKIILDIANMMVYDVYGEHISSRVFRSHITNISSKYDDQGSTFRDCVESSYIERQLSSSTVVSVLILGFFSVTSLLCLLSKKIYSNQNIIEIETPLGVWSNIGVMKAILLNMSIIYAKRALLVAFHPLKTAAFDSPYLRLPLVTSIINLQKR